MVDKNPYYYANFGETTIKSLKSQRYLPALEEVFRKKKEFYSIIREACAYNPKKRPSAKELIEKIEDFRQQEVFRVGNS